MFGGVQKRWETLVILLVFLAQNFIFMCHFEVGRCIEIQEKHRTQSKYDVVVGILSARDNFEYRQALRSTWVGDAKNEFTGRILIKFIVGDKPCLTPPQDRVDPYACERNEMLSPVFDEDIIAYKVPHGTSGSHFHRGPLGMDFKVNFPIVISHLGVFDSGSDGLVRDLVVRLYDRISQMEVFNASFTAEDPGRLIGGSRFKIVDQYVLPKGFEGSIVAENFSELDPSNNVPIENGKTNSGGGLITFRRVSRFGVTLGVFPESEGRGLEEANQYAAGTFIYRAYALSEGEFSKDYQQEKGPKASKRQREWEEMVMQNQTRLDEEILEYDDVLLVDAVDVYRNVSRKMLRFYQWVVENVEFNFTLKTDDDCFIDLRKIYAELDKYSLRGRPQIWWSRFRTDWRVDRHGKWQELDYTSQVYPAFACGAGNVMSSDLVSWLAKNAEDLKNYQGEDVSLGIWLSAKGPTLVKDYQWACTDACENSFYNSAQNSPEVLRERWNHWSVCGKPCGCE